MTTIEKRIKNRASELDITIPELAELTEEKEESVGCRTIYQWINGCHSPRYCNLKIVAETLRTTPDYLMGLRESKEEY